MPVGTAREAYDELAPDYDLLTAEYPYERWLAALEELARAHGATGHDVLDVACGTGKSFLPLLARGWHVVGCDISPAMLALAKAKAPAARLEQADMRTLPRLGEYDLVTCLDDALNYLLEATELEAALAGIRRNLRPDGIAIWDLNTLAQYRASFARDQTTDRDGIFLAWRGETAPSLEPGGPAQATVDVFAPARDGLWERRSSVHRQRHWPERTVRYAAARAGLRILAVHGQHQGAVLEPELDELVHSKAVYLAARTERR
ncbi:MAG TPA: class I SAM-dependent methyltransferase [Solirubrobacteraceae bacterium]|nr:class I SAM-dependent methyltransferase [Solirubrobacteraceae bacterium]